MRSRSCALRVGRSSFTSRRWRRACPAIPAPQDSGAFVGPPYTSPSVNQTDISSEPWASWHSRSLTRAGVDYTALVRRHQLQSLLSLDRSVKQIVSLLAQRHELERTVIFYTSDNGFLWGGTASGETLAISRVDACAARRSHALDGCQQTTNNQPILNIDFASTIARLAGIKPGLPQDGDSFAPMLHGRRSRGAGST